MFRNEFFTLPVAANGPKMRGFSTGAGPAFPRTLSKLNNTGVGMPAKAASFTVAPALTMAPVKTTYVMQPPLTPTNPLGFKAKNALNVKYMRLFLKKKKLQKL
jgi:hypothetical protein